MLQINVRRSALRSLALTLTLALSLVILLPLQVAHASKRDEAAGDHTFSLTMAGLERTYIVHVPAKYKPSVQMPLVIMLHGGGGTARAAMWETGWAAKADKENFLVVFPNAVARDPKKPSHFSSNPQLWNDGSERFYDDQAAVDDVSFIAALLVDLSTRFAVSERQVFLTGFSNGASMSFFAGARLADRIAAIAPVAGALWFDPPTFRLQLPLLYITGTADPLNLIEGGVPKLASGDSDKVRAKPKPPVRESIMKWGTALGCATQAASAKINGVRIETYTPCLAEAEVVYVEVDGLGHAWAGGRSILPESMVGKQTKNFSATDFIWTFFQKHRLPLPTQAPGPARLLDAWPGPKGK